jgi:hypothetical protein
VIKDDISNHLKDIELVWEITNDTQAVTGINKIEFKINNKFISIT